MKLIHFTTLLLFFIVSQSVCNAQSIKAATADSALNQLQAQNQFNGSVLVAKNGKIVYQKNVGMADFERHVPISANTKFELASVSKIFTAILVLQLVEAGKIKVDDKVSTFIPEFTKKDGDRITIHHLLSHTSGLKDFVGINCPFAGFTEKDFMEGLNKTPINFPPGSKFEYASSTYILLKFILERVEGKPYEHILKEKILDVAEMPNSGVIHNYKVLTGRALGYVSSQNGYNNALAVANHEIMVGAASIYSTVEDLFKLDQALYSDKLLGKSAKEKMFAIVQQPYGYGWFISESNTSGKVLSHGGDLFGYTTLIERGLKNKTLVVILGNQQSIDRELVMKILTPILE